jgi:O-antigen ligase
VRPAAEASPAPSLALGCLVLLATAAPWAVGGVLPLARTALTLAALGTLAFAFGWGAIRGGLALPAVALWPLGGYLALVLAQLIPLPAPLLRRVAPGAWAVWHPTEPALAQLLGSGPRPVSIDPGTSVTALALVAGLALLALVAAPAFAREREALRAVAVVATAGFVLSGYAILARARFGSLLYGRFSVPTVAPFGPFVSKNHFAGWSAMAALLAAGLAFGLAEAARRRSRDWTTDRSAGAVALVLVASLGMALATLASASRGGVLALAAGAAFLLSLRAWGARHARRTLVSWLLVTVLLGVVLASLVPREAQERIASLGGASFRIETWQGALRLWSSSPLLGQGLGSFHDAYPRFKRGYGFVRVEHAENDYLETLAETGALGLGLALAGVASLLAAFGRGGEARGAVARGVGQGAVAALVALAVHSGVDFDLRIPSNAALAALAASALAGVAGLRSKPLARTTCLALGALVCALAFVALSPASAGDAASAAREHVIAAAATPLPEARRLRLERAAAALCDLLRRRPAHAESWLLLAGVDHALGRQAAAAAFARRAAWLDPGRTGMRQAVAGIDVAP